ncbi:hypothetical protein [Kitasatospora sp. McL0602]|uniref:hypothetical protein n=1 Tax=Kitasatospora sp. McL0602 TaxID=3439530 RepID=UPI003F8A50B8
MAPDRDRIWRLTAVLLALAGAVGGALFFWSWGSPGAALPVLPLLLASPAALILAFLCSLVGWNDDEAISGRVTVTLLLTALLCVSAATANYAYASVHDWQRTPLAVTATLTECRVDVSHGDGDSGHTEKDSCVYHWTVDGQQHSERRESPGAEQDGNRLRIWLNPQTGEIADHSLTDVVLWCALAFLTGGLALLGAWDRVRANLRGPDPS